MCQDCKGALAFYLANPFGKCAYSLADIMLCFDCAATFINMFGDSVVIVPLDRKTWEERVHSCLDRIIAGDDGSGKAIDYLYELLDVDSDQVSMERIRKIRNVLDEVFDALITAAEQMKEIMK